MKNCGIIPMHGMPTKRDLLVFDSFVSMGGGRARVSDSQFPMKDGTAHFSNPCQDACEADYAFLTENGLIEENTSPVDEMFKEAKKANLAVEDIQARLALLLRLTEDKPYYDFGQLPPVDSGFEHHYQSEAYERYFEYGSHAKARIFSLLRSDASSVFTPILERESFPALAGERNDAVLQVVIENFPVPAGDVSLEDIVEFKRDKKVQDQLQLLRRWIRKTLGKEKATPAAIGEEIADNVTDFKASMDVAQMRYKTERMYTLMTFPLATIERIIKLQFSQIFDPVFSIRKAKITLLEAEMKAPGRELAFLNAAIEKFGAPADG